MYNFEKLSDKELFNICKKWGADVLTARRKMAAWARGGSWVRKRGFSCMYEFAARLAGMSRDQVDEVLRLEKRLVDKPVLRDALVRAENLHHEKGFAKDDCHDPRYLKPLCRGHHELVHEGVGGGWEARL